MSDATNTDPHPKFKDLIRPAQIWTRVSRCAHPIVYSSPIMGVSGPSSVVAVKLGHVASYMIVKCGLGTMIYRITKAMSKYMQAARLAK